MHIDDIIIGLGQTGLSCLPFLLRQGRAVGIVDSRPNPPGMAQLQQQYPEVPVTLGEFNEKFLSQAERLIVSPGVATSTPAIAACQAKGMPVLGDVELFAGQAKAPIIAITGTNGKTTVTTLFAAILKQAGFKVAVGGNIGTPVLQLLTAPLPDFYLLELSSFQLETTYSLKPLLATILNVSPDHLDRYADFAAYVQAKKRIYQQCQQIVYNRDESLLIENFSPQVLNFGFDEPGENQFGIRNVAGENYLAFENKNLLAVKQLLIKGKQSWSNALAALTLGQALQLPMTSMLQTLKTFKGLPHRCEWVADIKQVTWYNDSKGTNVGACVAAITGLAEVDQGGLILIAGGQGKGADFSVLQKSVKQHVSHLILFGEDAEQIAQALKGCAEIQMVKDLAAAVQLAYALAAIGDKVLFSPACASFDMFDNFAARGDAFKKLVSQLEEQT